MSFYVIGVQESSGASGTPTWAGAPNVLLTGNTWRREDEEQVEKKISVC